MGVSTYEGSFDKARGRTWNGVTQFQCGPDEIQKSIMISRQK